VSEEDRLVGTLIADRYRVERKLGEGGMGLVYLAVHEKLKKQVALKVLGTVARSQGEAIARFEREAVAAANLKHPNIAEATDFGQLPDGGLYLVMEYVEGTTLRHLLKEHGKLPAERALGILKQVAAALATAHARDVVHRDLKPENVIVTGANDAVKVIDFGIAKVRSATFGALSTGLTTSGSVFGTAEYMSPEQVMGQSVDARADQYALGVLAFELLTGKPPFQTEEVSRLMMMHVGAPVPSTRERTPALPADIDAVTSKMLAKLPDERFTSVTEAMEALTVSLAPPPPRPLSPPPPPPPSHPLSHPHPPPLSPPHPHPHPPPRNTLVVAILAAGVVVLLMLGAFVLARSASDQDKDEDEALTPSESETAAPTQASPASPASPPGKSKGKGKGKKK
jgi:eukaryotic-like serine/threonine-protein kinase